MSSRPSNGDGERERERGLARDATSLALEDTLPVALADRDDGERRPLLRVAHGTVRDGDPEALRNLRKIEALESLDIELDGDDVVALDASDVSEDDATAVAEEEAPAVSEDDVTASSEADLTAVSEDDVTSVGDEPEDASADAEEVTDVEMLEPGATGEVEELAADDLVEERPEVVATKPPARTAPRTPPPQAPAPAAAPARSSSKARVGVGAVAAAAAAAAAAPEPRTSKPRRSQRAWFEEIFDEDYLRTLPFLTPKTTQREAAFLVDALRIAPGHRVLDVGCGYGRHAMELSAHGFNVVALDLSLPLLLRGADEAQRRGLSIDFVHGDMRDMSFEAQFEGAYCVFSTFGYFDDDVNRKVAHNLARALKPGGRLVLDVLNRDYIVADVPTRVWWEGDGCVVLEEVDFNYFASRLVSNRSIVFEDGRQLEQEITIRAYGLHELGKLLHSAGFKVIEVSGGLAARGRFFGSHSRQIILVAEKRADPLKDAGPAADSSFRATTADR